MSKRSGKKGARGGARPGAGRPALVEEAADRTVRFERRYLEVLGELAEERGVTVGELVREAVAQYVARRGKR